MAEPTREVPAQRAGLLMTVEQVAELWFGDVGPGGSSSSNCQKIRKIPESLPGRRIGHRWFIRRSAAEAWVAECDPASVMAHPDTRAAMGV